MTCKPQQALLVGPSRPAAMAAVALAAALAGCAALPEERGPQGWVYAHVMAVGGDLPAPLRAADDCRRGAKPGDQFALVGFWRRGTNRWRIVRLDATQPAPSQHDYMRVNLDDCAIPATFHR